ncbi:S-layer family protein [Planktothrix sp. FACHB-1365]|uniref:beta strand repeat-containing protein n=1 Tax=Planktothrix sp. FACHB-1365 TaxID=2692855 RepID=UPI00168740D7|nr:hypothetical protein [Planktothrix sp. FACHB-1365]MBD2483243.1 hypothetical protein [Planktothrix sp. FACHB-1365]
MVEQIVSPNPTSLTTSPGQNISFDVTYQTSDGSKQNADKFGVSLYYDDRELTLVGEPNFNPDLDKNTNLAGFFVPQLDTANTDNDPNTNQQLIFGWAAVDNNWPVNTVTYPVNLFGIAFQATDIFDGTIINFTPKPDSGNGFTSPIPSPLNVTLTQATPAGITVAPTTGLTTDETGKTATFTVKLDTQPTADVTIPVVSSNTAEGTATPTSLVFTAANWDTAQTVTVTGVADNIVDADQAYTIQLQAATSTDANYNGKDATDVSVTNTNVDVAGITVAPTTGLTTDETGKTATFTVKLDTQPTADVTIPVVSSNTAEGTVAPESLVFTSANWNTAQTVTVTGVADNIVDADQAYTIQLQAATSTDANYNGKDATDVSVTNTNVDVAGITVAPTTGLTTDEFGKTATFTVKLDSQPTADVTIPVVSSNTAEGTAAPASLTFTSANWNTAQTVTVTGVADGIVDANQAYTIQLQAATSTDTNYSGKDATDVSVTNTNVDVPINVGPSAGITVSPTTGLTTSESGTTATFTVKLDSQPTANVTIPVVSSNTAEGTASPASLVFTAANWNTAQTVTVTGVADNTVDGDQAYTIELQPAVSTDANYKGKNATDVQVTNTNVTSEITLNTDEIDTLQGGEGADTFVLTGTPLTKPSIPSPTDFTEDQPNQLFGTDNDDVIIGSSGNETLLGFKGNDFLNGEGGGDELFGGVDNDTLVGSSSDELLYGNKNSDLVFGGEGLDTLYGGQDDDTLTGESGSDLVLGDKGDDVLYGLTDLGYTLISDFTPNEDVIQLTGSADNYRLTDAPAGTGVGTGIIRIDDQGNQQYIGVIEGVLMSQTSLTTSNFFQFV